MTLLPYIKRNPLYEKEKLYSSDLYVCVRDLRVQPPEAFDLNVHGFCILKSKTGLKLEYTLYKSGEVGGAYCTEVEAVSYDTFPEYIQIETMNFIVINRYERYPKGDSIPVSHEQAAAIPHSDFSLFWSVRRPFIGPNNDWSLGLCDWTSITEGGICDNDDLHRDKVTENTLLHANPNHRWYYISDQTPEDVIVFRITDTTGPRASGFHCAFHNPISASECRKNVEVRVVAIR
ncbi:hypothetical protein B0O99DRAFT_692008 [Bisporella sp. PMI_857]|nr:hypothetical protein B0O99DRAFT_692008 [Bisporella sp. PMI_857]